MRVNETISATPIVTQKSVRPEEIRALTSCRAGKIVPLFYAPLLREDRISRGNIRVRFNMAETIHPLMNAVNVTVMAHLIPFSAFDRFSGMDAFNRSYQGVKERVADVAPVPFFEMATFNKDHEIYKKMGIHHPAGGINTSVVEAYNVLVNFRRSSRSSKLPVRAKGDTSLAEAFWKNPNMYHIVPDFEQAMMDGEVLLSVNNALMPVRGTSKVKGITQKNNNTIASSFAIDGVDSVASVAGHTLAYTGNPGGKNALTFKRLAGNPAGTELDITADVSGLFVELEAQGLQLSLSNIDLAKKTVAFAKMRERYKWLSDEHLIALLMEGIRVPDEALRQPILLDKKSTIFGYSERHAMDGDNLDMSRTTGETSVDLRIRTPAMNTGGILLITAEIVPEQLFERQLDTFLGISSPDDLPNFLRDFLDPEKVEVVQNKFVDTYHSTPTGTFGYAPLNHAWKRSITRIGGKFYRPVPDTFVEDRQRFWSYEQANPALTTDFYLVGNLPHSVFADTLSDPFEVLSLGALEIIGNTVFGKVLEEDDGNYEAVSSEVDHSKIVLP